MFSDVEKKLKKRNKILFSRDSKCLEELLILLDKQMHRTVVMWALDCAKTPLEHLEKEYPMELRPRKALKLCEDWSRGKIKMSEAKRAILEVHAFAKEIDDEVYIALCHAIGHAGATVHVKTHALNLVLYELTSIVLKLKKVDYEKQINEKIKYYIQRLIYWQENIDKIDFQWAKFLMKDKLQQKPIK